jgi:phosphoinositide-3-kinase regulatory subunit 4
MGNTHSGFNFTRTSGALDSFVAELGGDIVYDKRYMAPSHSRSSNILILVL